ncbi:hypothetical protein [Pedobacter sp. ASV28]|uniref:hypothetical protein n=1 Tax=Pedobacter sp. ASV28 TaxID=2795123 RepID=UPI0018EDDD88|nr:hypothetical protein [Pedobacter sp. ASV28]
MPDNLYYPALSRLINVGELPESLSFIQEGIGQVFDNVFYKDFISSTSIDGSSAFYSLAVVSRKKLAFELFGSGISFVLNPDYEDGSISSFPVTLFWEWKILKYFSNFKFETFSFQPDAFFDFAIVILGISKEQVLRLAISTFVTPEEPTISSFGQLVADINLLYSATITIDEEDEDKFEQLTTQVEQLNENVFTTVFTLYLLDANLQVTRQRLDYFFGALIPTDLESYIKDLFIPRLRASLTLSAAIEFPRNILLPLKETPEGLVPDDTLDAEGQLKKTLLKFAEADLDFDTERGLYANTELAGSLIPARVQIGNTGLIIGFTNVKLDFSKTSNIPEADAAGYPTDFVGVYAQEAILGFRNFGTPTQGQTSAEIKAENLFIGTGGVSGMFTLTAGDWLNRDFGGFKARLDVFRLAFKMGSIVSSEIKGQLTLNKLKQNGQDAVINISAQIKDDGNFSITAISEDIPPLNFLDVLEIKVKSLQLGKEDRGYYAEVAGTLSFTFNIPGLGDVLPKDIPINKLRIWDDGKLEFEPGIDNISIAKTFPLEIGPVKMEISNISISGHKGLHQGIERHYLVFAFDGMVNTGRAGINTSGNGIKFYFTIDDDGPFHAFLSIDRLNIDMSIPGNVTKDKAAFLLNGYLTMANPNEQASSSAANIEYGGAVTFSLPRLKMTGSAGMRLKPSVPAFVVDIGLELPTPIILGATGLGIYGFRGIIGQHYLPSKSATTPPLGENATWWQYYKAKSTITHKEGIEIDKFASKSGFSVGAGASIATAFDSGKVFSSKLFLLLGLPDVFLMQGQAGILRSRVGLNDTADPPFSAFISIDSNAFMAGLGVNYNLPDVGGSLNGAIFSLSGTMELAFFFNNASGWYLNLGKDQPENQRIRSRILTLFQGYAYLMISSKGFKAGAGAKFDFNRSYGVAAVAFGAWIDMGGSLSFKPVQIGAFIRVGGYAYIRVWKAKLSMTIVLGLAVDAPHPFIIQGSIYISLRVLFFKIKFTLELTWRINNDKGPLLAQQPVIELPDPIKGYLPAAATNIQSGDVFKINHVAEVFTGDGVIIPPPPSDPRWRYNMLDDQTGIKEITIPLDSYIDIDLLKAVKPSFSKLGGGSNQLAEGYSELIPPQKGLSPQVRHEYELISLDIYCWDPNAGTSGTWKPYQIYEAVTAIVKENTDEHGAPIINLNSLKTGYWQFSQPNRYNKIRLLSQNMFSYANQSTDTLSDLDGLNFKRKDLFCFETISKQQLINWKDVAAQTNYPDFSTFYQGGYTFRLLGASGEVVNNPSFGGNSLTLTTYGGKLVIYPSNPVTFLKLALGQNENRIRIDFIKRIYITEVIDTGTSAAIVAVPQDYFMPPVFAGPDQDGIDITYNDLNNAIGRIEINFEPETNLSFEGNLTIGGHFKLADEYAVTPVFPQGHDQEKDKALVYLSLFDRAFTATEVVTKGYQDTTGAVANWLLSATTANVGNLTAIPLGSPDLRPGFFKENITGQQTLGRVYAFNSREDALLIPYQPVLKIEEADFAVETMVVFNPFNTGISTLFSKVAEDPLTGDKKGYALHLLQEDTVHSYTDYSAAGQQPSCAFYFTCYSGQSRAGFKISEYLSLDCSTGYVSDSQFKHLFIVVDRTHDTLEIFIDKIKKLSVAIPEQLKLTAPVPKHTTLHQLSYLTEEIHRRQNENELTEEKLFDEITLMGDGLNKTIQPVWRPNTIYALSLKTRDLVVENGQTRNATQHTQTFGFKTAGPIGHFHQQSVVYDDLLAQDRADEFKLSNLKNYIDYERSFPDAQSRYDLSKPVFYHHPKIRLLFTKPYIYAMFEDFDSYQGLAAVKSSLELMVVDVFGGSESPALVWEQLPDRTITIDNYRSLPPDQQVIFLMNLAASSDSCNTNPLVMKKRTKQGGYQLDDLFPNKVYTAIFSAKYQPVGEAEKSSEVHRFNFISSRYASFQEQASSFILDSTPENERYAIYPLYTSFSITEINNNIIPLLDDSPTHAAEQVMRYAVKYDRIIYGGLKLKNLEHIETTVLQPLVNIDPDTEEQRVLGLIIRNPEPFNDPKLPTEPIDLLADTLTLHMPEHTAIAFKYIHARNTSAVLVTNASMDFPTGLAQLTFKYKMFNGENYTTAFEQYISPEFNLEINTP